MPGLEKITVSPRLTFDALVAGEPGAPLVLLLHGFAESMHCWRAQLDRNQTSAFDEQPVRCVSCKFVRDVPDVPQLRFPAITLSFWAPKATGSLQPDEETPNR